MIVVVVDDVAVVVVVQIVVAVVVVVVVNISEIGVVDSIRRHVDVDVPVEARYWQRNEDVSYFDEPIVTKSLLFKYLFNYE